MQYFTINGPKPLQVELPSSWAEVTLEIFQKISAIKGNSEEENKLIELSILTGRPVNDFRQLPKSIVMQMINFVGKFLNIEKTEVPEFTEFSHSGETYILPKWDYSEMTFGEWMDAKTVSTIKDEFEGNVFDNAHMLIAVLCRKKGEKEYDSSQIQKIAESFKTLPMDKVFLIVNFFLQQRTESLKNLVTFSSRLLNRHTEDMNTLTDSDIMERLLTLLDLEDLPNKDLLRQKVSKLRHYVNALPISVT
jgi:hypothetical protein